MASSTQRKWVTHNGGQWNLRVGRHPGTVAAEVREFLHDHDLDWCLVCEASGYIDALRHVLEPLGYVVDTDMTDDSSKDSAIIRRHALDVPTHRRGIGRAKLHRLGGVKWERKPGRPGLHWARSAVSQSLDGLNALATHLPPGPFGPRFPLRKRAYRAAMLILVALGARWTLRGPWLMGGDWNKHKGQAGGLLDPSPAWMATKLGATIVGDGIDYVMAKGCTVWLFRRWKFGTSDHKPVTYKVGFWRKA